MKRSVDKVYVLLVFFLAESVWVCAQQVKKELNVKSAADTSNHAGGANEPIRYIGSVGADPHFHDGALRPVIGVQSYQAFRANRKYPELADGFGWTYSHQPYLIYWNNQFLLQYLSGPVNELEVPGHTLITTSTDGSAWKKPLVVFPKYALPDGTFAAVHQRMGFYITKDKRLLTLGFYGILERTSMNYKEHKVPNDGKGIGRVVREIYKDRTMGPIYFIKYNEHAGWNASNTSFPKYASSADDGFVKACNELLSNRLVTQQWWEEDRSNDGFFTATGHKALSYYHRKDGKVVGLWKYSRAAISSDEGESWSPIVEVPTIIAAGQKMWGQKMSDGRYAIVYNPTRNNWDRWPLSIITGDDGISFDNLLTICGEVPPMRYAGQYKGYGPQYVTGIAEANGKAPGNDMWLTYSINKEDIWVSRVPIPVRYRETENIKESFTQLDTGTVIKNWNIYSPQYASVRVVQFPGTSNKCMKFSDRDPYDYGKAVKVFRESSSVEISFSLYASQHDKGRMEMNVMNEKGEIPLTLVLNQRGEIVSTNGQEMKVARFYETGDWKSFKLKINTQNSTYDLFIDGNLAFKNAPFAAKVKTVERISFATGEYRTKQPFSLPITGFGSDMPFASELVDEFVFYLDNLIIN